MHTRWAMVRWYRWVPAAVAGGAVVGCLVGVQLGGPQRDNAPPILPAAMAGAEEPDSVPSSRPDSAAPDDSVPGCADTGGWRPATNGHGIAVRMLQDGPATVTVSVLATSGVTTKSTATSSIGESVFVDFPEVYPLSVHAVYVTSQRLDGPPQRCALRRSDR